MHWPNLSSHQTNSVAWDLFLDFYALYVHLLPGYKCACKKLLFVSPYRCVHVLVLILTIFFTVWKNYWHLTSEVHSQVRILTAPVFPTAGSYLGYWIQAELNTLIRGSHSHIRTKHARVSWTGIVFLHVHASYKSSILSNRMRKWPCVLRWAHFCYIGQFSQSHDIFHSINCFFHVWYPTPIKVYISEKEIVQGIQKCNQKRHMVKP